MGNIRRRLGTLEALDVTALLDTLTQSQLKNLKNHQYSCSGKSLLEPLYIPWWNKAIDLCPFWIAPNMITLIGLLLNLSGFLIMAYYCGGQCLGEAPRWVYFYAGFALFLYQTLDAIDGKQARRTGTGSPLGELFDHGMDCIANCFILPMICMTIQGGNDLDKSFLLAFACFLTFYSSHWVHYVTGALKFGYIDITEIQTSTIGLFILTGILGPEYWSEDFVIPLIKNRDTVIYGSLAICIFGLTRMTFQLSGGGSGPNQSSVAGTSILSPGPNIFFILAIGYIVGCKTGLMYDHPTFYIMYIALLSAKATHKLVVANLTKASLRISDPCVWNITLLGFNQYMENYIAPTLMFQILLAYSIFDMIRYCVFTYTQIADYLGIGILTIPKENQKLKAT